MKTLEYVELDEEHIITPNGEVYKKKKPNINKNGYMKIGFNGKSVYLHRIVAKAFYGDSDMQVDHINGDKQDNSVKNLEYVTAKENSSRANGVRVIWNGIEYNSLSDFAREHKQSKESVSRWCRSKRLYKGHMIERVIE